ncbi:hypothetical protein [Nocardia crassostreae]|uniref:hypothetical protein n=1 Tax=Nocardia crassostreae TaxID=53428 RepID=UPI00082C08E5|nr:hypothetical protein [Nocardia crassostreae]
MTSPARRRTVESFAGTQLHCTRWRDECSLAGRSVAVIGSGAAVARVLPPVVQLARKVTVFQHDPVWVLPWPELPGARAVVGLLPDDLLGQLPADTARPLPGDTAEETAGRAGNAGRGVTGLTGRIARWAGASVLRHAASANLRVQVRDSWQRRQLTPDMAAGVRLHNHYYAALQRPNCKLVTWPVARLAPLGIRTVDGIEHRVELIIHAEDRP